MRVASFAGKALIALGAGCGLLLLLSAYGIPFEGGKWTLWILFALCFVGGVALCAIGEPTELCRTLQIASAVLFVLAVAAALSILLAKAALIVLADGDHLWALFLVSLIAGTATLVVVRQRMAELRHPARPHRLS